MANEFERKFSNDIFKSSHDSIIHYKYGAGKIINENEFSYVVAFPKGAKSILKEKLILD